MAVGTRRPPPEVARILMDWGSLVGPALAAVALPRRLSDGTLDIVCTTAGAEELQHLAAPLMSRINAHLGRAAVTRLRFIEIS